MNSIPPIEEVYDDLEACVDLLQEAGRAYRSQQEEILVANLSAMAPRLERAYHTLGQIIEGREESYKINTYEMDSDLDCVDLSWGTTKSPPNAPVVTDGVVFLYRKYVQDQGILETLENTRKKIKATPEGIDSFWLTVLGDTSIRAQWGGTVDDQAIFNLGESSVTVDAGRLALIREVTGFTLVEVSLEEQTVVFSRQDSVPDPVAMMLYNKEIKQENEKVGKNHRSPELG